MSWIVKMVRDGDLNYKEVTGRLRDKGIVCCPADEENLWFIKPHPMTGDLAEVTTEELLHLAGSMDFRQ